MGRKAFFFGLVALSAGCDVIAPRELVPPGEVTVENAITDVALGLASFNRINRRNNLNSGLLVDEVNINLELAASATNSNKLVVDLSRQRVGSGVTRSSSSKGEVGAGSAANVGNTVEIKFKNISTASLNELGKDGKSVSLKPRRLDLFGANAKVEIDCGNPSDNKEAAACLTMAGE